MKKLRPTVLIGAAAISGVFTPEIIRDMARLDLHSFVLFNFLSNVFVLLLRKLHICDIARLDLNSNVLLDDLLIS